VSFIRRQVVSHVHHVRESIMRALHVDNEPPERISLAEAEE